MGKVSVTTNGVVRQQWDDDLRVYTEYDDTGAVTLTREYTVSEGFGADIRAALSTPDTVEQNLRSKASNAIAANNTFLALASPTNAQTLAQVQRLTRENTALIKLVLRQLDNSDGT